MPINPSPAVLRACDVLDVLAASPSRRFSVSELARTVQVPRATCDSLMLAFLDRGWVTRDEELRYGLAARCIALGDAARQANPVLDVAAAEAAALARRLHACVAVAAGDGSSITVTAVADFSPPFSVSVRVGQSVPVRAPFAAVFVAWEGAERIARWLAQSHLGEAETVEYTEALGEIRRRGYSVTVNKDRHLLDRFAELSGAEPTAATERSMDVAFRALVETHHLPVRIEPDAALRVSQMSAPIFDAAGSVAASLLVLGSSELMSASDIGSLGSALLQSTAAVTRSIGGRLPPLAA